jgi:hypothetical protein
MKFLREPRMYVVNDGLPSLKFFIMAEVDEPDLTAGRSSTIYRVDCVVPAGQRNDKDSVVREAQRAFNKMFDSMGAR